MRDGYNEVCAEHNSTTPLIWTCRVAVVKVITKSGTNDFHGFSLRRNHSDKLSALITHREGRSVDKETIPNEIDYVFFFSVGGPILSSRIILFLHSHDFNGRRFELAVYFVTSSTDADGFAQLLRPLFSFRTQCHG
jgi:hypothetical protein